MKESEGNTDNITNGRNGSVKAGCCTREGERAGEKDAEDIWN